MEKEGRGPKMVSNQVYIVMLWSTWDHYLVYAMIQDDDAQICFAQNKKY